MEKNIYLSIFSALGADYNQISENEKSDLILYAKASKAYYDEEAIISDVEFDNLIEKLLSYGNIIITTIIEKGLYIKDNIIITDEESTELISLKKIKYTGLSSVSDIKKFFEFKMGRNYVFAPKLDGNALRITILSKIDTLADSIIPFIRIISRGGLDVTNKFGNNKSIISVVKLYKGNLEICGELLIAKKLFEEKHSDEYENPRNYVGSLMKNDYVDDETVQELKFIPYSDGKNPISTIWNTLVDWNNLVKEISFYKSDEFPYLCDGLVIAYKEEGPRRIKDNYPLNMVAIKFKAPSVKTVVIDIKYTQKKSGVLTPVIILHPVKLDGCTISKAAGYNYHNIKNNHIGIGAVVLITKSGDIIPVVDKVVTPSDKIPLPDCDYIIDGLHLIANNLETSRKYKFILGLKILEIDGIGPEIATKIGSVIDFDIVELFNVVHKANICDILGGGKIWNKFENFYQIKTIYLNTLIELLQFDRCGKVLSERFAKIISKQSTNISGIDEKCLNNVCRGNGFLKIRESMNLLNSYGIKVIKPVEINEDTIAFEMTGNPPNGMTKDDFIKQLKLKYPNSVHTTLTKKTKYLFVDNVSATSSKANKARKYNIKIVTYKDALDGKIS